MTSPGSLDEEEGLTGAPNEGETEAVTELLAVAEDAEEREEVTEGGPTEAIGEVVAVTARGDGDMGVLLMLLDGVAERLMLLEGVAEGELEAEGRGAQLRSASEEVLMLCVA